MTEEIEEKKTRPRKNIEEILDKYEERFRLYDEEIKTLRQQPVNQTLPVEDKNSDHGLSQKQIAGAKEILLKPLSTQYFGEKFNEKFRSQWEYMKQPVRFIAEHMDLIGVIEIWTKDFPGAPAEYWEVPCNKVCIGPRYLAENIKNRTYNVVECEENKVVSEDGHGKFTGQLVRKKVRRRLDANPASTTKSVFMGA